MIDDGYVVEDKRGRGVASGGRDHCETVARSDCAQNRQPYRVVIYRDGVYETVWSCRFDKNRKEVIVNG